MALPSGPMIMPLSSAGVAARVWLARRYAFSATMARTLSQVWRSMIGVVLAWVGGALVFYLADRVRLLKSL